MMSCFVNSDVTFNTKGWKKHITFEKNKCVIFCISIIVIIVINSGNYNTHQYYNARRKERA